MGQLFIGFGILLFGIFIGGVGLASAGIGIGIPMIPLGIYICYRGFRIVQHEKVKEQSEVIDLTPLESFEKTKVGKTALGSLLILIGVGTSAFIIGIPIFLVGVWLIYLAWQAEVKVLLNKLL